MTSFGFWMLYLSDSFSKGEAPHFIFMLAWTWISGNPRPSRPAESCQIWMQIFGKKYIGKQFPLLTCLEKKVHKYQPKKNHLARPFWLAEEINNSLKKYVCTYTSIYCQYVYGAYTYTLNMVVHPKQKSLPKGSHLWHFSLPKKERRVGNCTHFWPSQVPQMLGSPHAGRQAKVRWLVPGMDVEWIPWKGNHFFWKEISSSDHQFSGGV